MPDAVEQRGDELAPFKRRGLFVPEAREVVEQRFGLCERRVDRRRVAGELFLDRLPLHDVLVLGQVAEHVEVAEPIELAVELAAAGGVVAAEPLCFGADDVEDVCAHVFVGLEVVQPFDELRLERFGLGDRLAAAFRVAAS